MSWRNYFNCFGKPKNDQEDSVNERKNNSLRRMAEQELQRRQKFIGI